jgi:GAF domain-containing protein
MSSTATMFTNLISKIHDCSREDDILQSGVESVKQALACDRAVVYSLQAHNLGKIVAESVAPGFPRTMETTIDDPCFKARYIDSYRQGRVSAIENIYEAKITPCHLENLEKLAVKANLVVPLPLPDSELYGLLIIHQCSQPRAWEPAEIAIAVQMAAQIGWALDNAVRWSESQRIQSSFDRQKYYNQLLEIATQKIHQGNTRLEVLQIATTQAQTILECDRAIVYGITEPNVGRIAAESTLSALAPTIGMTIEDPCFAAEYLDRYQHGGILTIDNIHEAGIGDYFVENLVKIGVKASLTVPIVSSQDELFGLLVVHQCFNYRHWQDLEIELLRQIGIQTGLALTKAHIQEEATAMKSSLKRAGLVKDTITTADTQMQHVKDCLNSSVETLEETKHLMRLLSHEVLSLTEKLSNEDINLVRIIAKKLQGNTEKATTGALSLQTNIAELETAIDSAIQMYKSRRNN